MNGDTYVTDQGIRPETNLRNAVAAEAGVQGRRKCYRRKRVADLRLRRGELSSPWRARRQTRSGCEARARIVDQTTVGVDPVIMLTGPIPATKKLLERNGMKMDDIDLVRDQRGVRVRPGRLAPGAGARHGPRERERLAPSPSVTRWYSMGARRSRRRLHQARALRQGDRLVTMCCGGGLGTGTLIQRV